MFTTRANHLLAVAFVAVVYGFVITCPVVVANHDDAPSSEARRRPLLGSRYHPGHGASYHRRRRRDVKRGQRHAQRHRTHDERQRQPRPPSRVLPRGDEKGRRGGDDDDDDNDYDREKWRVDNDEEDSRGTKKTKKLKKLRKDKIKERERVHDEVDVAVWHDVGRLDSENIAGDNLFDPARSSSSSPSSSSLSTTYPPSPSPTETVCRSIIAVGSTRLFDDDPALIPSHHRASSSRALYDDDDYDEEFVCELYDGTTVPLLSSSRQLRTLRESLQEGTLLSAISTIDYVIPDVVEVEVEVEVEVYESPSPSAPPIHGGGDDGSSVTTTISDPSSSDAPSSFPSSRASTTTTTTTTTTVIESVTLPPGEILIRTDPEPPDEERRGGRALRLSGNRPVLAVRVTAQGDGGTVSANAMTISNKLFGTSGDAETMMSQFASCSFGRFNVAYDASDGRLSAPGVLDVTIGITLDNPRNVVRAAMQYAVEEKLGIKLPGPYGHVMFVVATCKQECGWAAYAYVGSWLSVFQGNYYAYPAVAMHEIGHNLNLGHSGGLDGKPYSDHTCLMGNPLYKDDVADMCFNPAKNYQITANGGGWYDPGRVETYSPSTGAIWQGKLVGVAESGVVNGNAEHANSRLVLKIETGTRIDLYVGFNRATGMNEDNKQASNMVTIVEANGDGLSYSTSALRATLSQGQSYSVANWRGTDVTLTLFVDTIRYDIVPGYADVRVVLEGNRASGVTTPSPTARPSKMPTPSPTARSSKMPTTSRPVRSSKPTSSPTMLPTPDPTTEPTIAPSQSLSPSTLSPASLSPVTLSPVVSLKPRTTGQLSLSTNVVNSKGKSKSIMFTIKNIANQDVIIRGFDIINRRRNTTVITIYTQDGTLEELGDDALTMEGWNMIYQSQKMGDPMTLMPLDDFTAEVSIGVGQAKSFYVHSLNGLMYRKNDDTSDRMVSEITEHDGAIAILEGRVLRGLFRSYIGTGKFGGVVRYYTSQN